MAIFVFCFMTCFYVVILDSLVCYMFCVVISGFHVMIYMLSICGNISVLCCETGLLCVVIFVFCMVIFWFCVVIFVFCVLLRSVC